MRKKLTLEERLKQEELDIQNSNDKINKIKFKTNTIKSNTIKNTNFYEFKNELNYMKEIELNLEKELYTELNCKEFKELINEFVTINTLEKNLKVNSSRMINELYSMDNSSSERSSVVSNSNLKKNKKASVSSIINSGNSNSRKSNINNLNSISNNNKNELSSNSSNYNYLKLKAKQDFIIFTNNLYEELNKEIEEFNNIENNNNNQNSSEETKDTKESNTITNTNTK